MDEKFMKVLREQQEIQQKAARILHDTEKMKEEVQNKLESLKRKVENDFKNIGEFLKEANVQFATYEYIFQEDDCKRIQINEQKYQTCIYVVVNQQATCITKARSNYFSVTDVPAFLTIMQKWEKDFGIRIMKKRIDEDQTVYAFSYETTSVNINDALCDLQKILPEWEAVIIQEIAYEQSLNGMMRYVIGKAIIITYNTVDTLDLSMLALQRTRKILANANFDAMMNY